MTHDLKLPEIVEKYYAFCIWIIPKISKFQKDQRYILGTAIENKALELLDMFIKAALESQFERKITSLSNANTLLQQLKYQIRIAGDIKMMNHASCAHAAKLLSETGTKTGLWYKSLKNR